MGVTPISKRANGRELQTAVYFKSVERITDDEGFPVEKKVNLLGQDETGRDIPARVKWVNAHGTDVVATIQQELREAATITMRYHPGIVPGLLVYKLGSGRPYKIISVDNVEERCRWLEIKVQRELLALNKPTPLMLEAPRYKTDALLQRVPDGTDIRQVWCSVKTIDRAEWTAAARKGLKITCCVTIQADEYRGETVAVLNGVRYCVCRTFQPSAEEMELYLEQKAGI